MKCIIPEISWHNRDPVLTVDIQPSKDEFYRLASGGTDTHVLVTLFVVDYLILLMRIFYMFRYGILI